MAGLIGCENPTGQLFEPAPVGDEIDLDSSDGPNCCPGEDANESDLIEVEYEFEVTARVKREFDRLRFDVFKALSQLDNLLVREEAQRECLREIKNIFSRTRKRLSALQI